VRGGDGRLPGKNAVKTRTLQTFLIGLITQLPADVDAELSNRIGQHVQASSRSPQGSSFIDSFSRQLTQAAAHRYCHWMV
jgi:hypothetical protein